MDEKWPIDNILEGLRAKYEDEGISDYWDSEQAGLQIALERIWGNLEQLSGNRENGRYSFKKVLGVGGSAVVLRIADTLFPNIDNALKFPRPVQGKIALIADMLKKEIGYLADLKHPGIVRILYHQTLDSVEVYKHLPFYIMEFVDGAKSQEFVRDTATTEKQLCNIVGKVADTISYLHAGSPDRFAHLDIKPDNIMITADAQPMIIDLGTCKRIGADETVTTVACTKSHAHPDLIRRLVADPTDENRSKGQMARSEIEPSWDLWAFALTILDWVGIDRSDGKAADNAIYHRLTSYTRKYCMLLVARTLTDSLPSWLLERVGLPMAVLKEFRLTSAEQLAHCIARLDGRDNPLGDIEELGSSSSGTLQAAPGTHVALTGGLLEVMEHRRFRRLNSISQLGLVSHVYPGCRHSRREHCLGTYALTGRMLQSLYSDAYSPLFRQVISEDDCRATLLAALLHDIGQFPLAHELEDIDPQLFDHDGLTQQLLKGESTAGKSKGKSRAVIGDSIDKVYAAWRTTPERVLSILSAKPTSAGSSRKDKLLRSVFNGPLDADKLDYLLRDAIQTNVPYAFGVDIDRIIRCMTVVCIHEGSARDVLVTGVHSKAKVAAESLAFARYAMFSQVYWHHAVRAQVAMLSRAVGALLARNLESKARQRLKSSFQSMVAALPDVLYLRPAQQMAFPSIEGEEKPEFGFMQPGTTDLAPTDAAVLCWFREVLSTADAPEKDLIDGILKRTLFKRLWVVSYEMEQRRWSAIVKLWDGLDKPEKRHQAHLEFEEAMNRILTPAKITSVTTLRATDARSMIGDYTAGKIPWLLIDVPGERPGADIGLRYVLEGQRRQLRKNDRTVGDLAISPTWKVYAEGLRESAGKIRVFCHPKLVDAVEASLSTDEGLDALEDALTKAISWNPKPSRSKASRKQ